MIVFDLRCGGGHVFEAWFGSSADYDDQRGRGLLECPMCGDRAVGKAVMAPRLGGGDTPDPAKVKAFMAELAGAQKKALDGSTWVGRRFATEARAIHAGEREAGSIHGQATVAEARALARDGVPIAPLPFPVVPPEASN